MMKTTPNVEIEKISVPVSRTDFDSTGLDQSVTEKNENIGDIKLPVKREYMEDKVSKIDCHVEFSFEKERIKALENTEFFASLNTLTVNPDTVMTQNRIKEIIFNTLAMKGKEQNDTKKSKDAIGRIIKNTCIVFILFATGDIIATLFGLLFVSVSNMLNGDFTLWLILEVLIAILFVIVSLKGTKACEFTLLDLVRYFKYLFITGVLLICFLVAILIQKNLEEGFECAMTLREPGTTYEEYVEAALCVVLICLAFATMYKILIIAAYSILSVLLWRQLKIVEEAEQQANESQRIQCVPIP